MKVLVTGGAGYIGSVTVQALRRSGHQVVVLDNLSTGHKEAVWDAELVVGDLCDGDCVRDLLRRHRFEAVIHFAAACVVAESLKDPQKYYQNNIVGSLHLLDAMREYGPRQLIFSSSAATYGMPEVIPIPEDHAQRPITPYGFTKYAVEVAIRDYAYAYGYAAVILRYFNAAGASTDGKLGEDHFQETHLIPLVLQAASGQRPFVAIYGTDYPTPDGTCVRDFVHVEDLADAHVRALELLSGREVVVLNVGTGRGHSVREVIRTAERITGRRIAVEEAPRRPGDPPILVAAADRIRQQLGWEPRYSRLEQIIESAWRWHLAHPHGYRTATSSDAPS